MEESLVLSYYLGARVVSEDRLLGSSECASFGRRGEGRGADES